MRKTAIIGVLSLLVMLAMAAPSAAVVTYYLQPVDSSLPSCGSTQVELRINGHGGSDYYAGGQIGLIYDPSCANVTNVVFDSVSTGGWLYPDPYSSWNAPGWSACWDRDGVGMDQDWITWQDMVFQHSDDRLICTITINCSDPSGNCDYCTTRLNFTCGEDCSCCPIQVADENGDTVPWNLSENGTFTCGIQEIDLIVESVSINPDCKHYYFANEPNVVNVTVKNIGTGTAGPSNASVSGTSGTSVAPVGALNPGQSETVTITDTIARPAGEVVTAIADCYGQVAECNETNNTSPIIDDDGNDHVINHGLKGKWLAEGYAGPDPGNMTTWKSYELHGNLNYSVGDSAYLGDISVAWDTYTANWTAGDLPISDGATVVEARLYVYYTWDRVWVMPDNVSMSFNGVNQDPYDVHYTDRRGYGTMASYNFPYGALVYNVTDDFNRTSNHAVLNKTIPSAPKQVAIRGMMLVVVYEDPTEPLRQIFVTEEFDNLYAGALYCTTPEEATARALFTGPSIDMGTMVNANLITIVNGADPNEGDLIFNGQVWTNVWNFAGTTELGIDERDVMGHLGSTDNAVGFQSNGDWMEPSNAFLVVEYGEQTGTCGDVDGIPGVTMNDGRQIFMNIIYGSAQYPINDPWAADCDGLCDGMTMNDGRQIFMNIIYGSAQYPLNCTCP